jgi:hypothetical protein
MMFTNAEDIQSCLVSQRHPVQKQAQRFSSIQLGIAVFPASKGRDAINPNFLSQPRVLSELSDSGTLLGDCRLNRSRYACWLFLVVEDLDRNAINADKSRRTIGGIGFPPRVVTWKPTAPIITATSNSAA